MSEFGNTLRALIPVRSSARELAKRMKINPSVLSKFMTGARTSCNPETLERIIDGITANRSDRAALLAAYLSDQKVGSISELVDITVRSKGARLKRPSNDLSALCARVRLDQASIDAVRKIIRTIPTSRNLRRSLIDLGTISQVIVPDGAPGQH